MTQIFSILGTLLILYDLYLGFTIKQKAPGGLIGKQLSQLNLLTVLFAVGYLVITFLIWNYPADTLYTIISLLLLLGAAFIFLVIRLIQAILTAIG
ncbi:MAG: hypothetical protein ACUVRV_03705 [Cyanobacteriota bacterium]